MLGPAAWSGYLAFDHRDPVTSNLELRLALAHAIDREALARGRCPPTSWWRRAASCRRRCRATRPTSRSGSTPTARASTSRRGGVDGPLARRVPRRRRRCSSPSWTAGATCSGSTIELRAWTLEQAIGAPHGLREVAPIVFTGWLPGYADPEYFLRLLFQSDSKTNEGGFSLRPSTS